MSAANLVPGDDSEIGARRTAEGAREPSMEEILASIRRIIAQDQLLVAAEAGGDLGSRELESGRAASSEAPIDDPGQEVDAMNPAPIGGDERAPPGSEADQRAGAAEALVSPATEGSAARAFATLVASRFAQDPEAILAMTREALRPLVASWLDAHLPSLVERMVSAEIERIAGGAPDAR